MPNHLLKENGRLPSKGSRVFTVIKGLFGQRAKTIYLRVFALVLFVVGALLTFVPHVFEFFSHHLTERPEILPVTLMVPYLYLIFEMVLSRLEKDEDTTEQVRRFESRLSAVNERRLERRTVVEAFHRSLETLPKLTITAGTEAICQRVALTREPTLQLEILAYSSETLLDGLTQLASGIKSSMDANLPPPDKVHFKILTRDLDAEWKIPCLTSREADEDYRRGLAVRFGHHLSRWHVEFFRAFEFLPKDRIVLDMRCYPFEPIYKTIILNRTFGVVGAYDIHNISHHGVEGWDYHGHGVSLYEIGNHLSDVRAQEALSDYCALFDTLWTQYSKITAPF